MMYYKCKGVPRLEVFGFDRFKNLDVKENAIFKLKTDKVKYSFDIHSFIFDESDSRENAIEFIYNTLKGSSNEF